MFLTSCFPLTPPYALNYSNAKQLDVVVYKHCRHKQKKALLIEFWHLSYPSLFRYYCLVNTVICIYCKWWRPWVGTEHGAAGSRHRAKHSTSKGLRYPCHRATLIYMVHFFMFVSIVKCLNLQYMSVIWAVHITITAAEDILISLRLFVAKCQEAHVLFAIFSPQTIEDNVAILQVWTDSPFNRLLQSKSDLHRWFQITMMQTLKRRSNRWANAHKQSDSFKNVNNVVLIALLKKPFALFTADWHHGQGPGWVYDRTARLQWGRQQSH